MTRPPVRVDPPAALPVELDEVKAYFRGFAAPEDAHLTRLIKSAVARLDGYPGYLGRAIIHQTWRQDFDTFPSAYSPKLRLKLPDVASATISWPAVDGSTVTAAEGYRILRDFIGWYVEPLPGWPSLPCVAPLSVEYVAGYGMAPDDVDDAVREAICLMVQSAASLTGEDATLRNETIDGVGAQGFFGPEIMRNSLSAQVKDLLKHARWRPM